MPRDYFPHILDIAVIDSGNKTNIGHAPEWWNPWKMEAYPVAMCSESGAIAFWDAQADSCGVRIMNGAAETIESRYIPVFPSEMEVIPPLTFADAEHIAGELMKSFLLPRPLPEDWLRRAEERFPGHGAALRGLQVGIAAVPLVSGSALPTAFANDADGALLFAQRAYALARPGDILWALSTSGRSANVNHALRVARLRDCATLGFTGGDGGDMAPLLDVELRAPSSCVYRVQELHLPMYHALCACVEACLFTDPPPRR